MTTDPMTTAVEAAARATHPHLYNGKLRDSLTKISIFTEEQAAESAARKRVEVEAKYADVIEAALPILRANFAEEVAVILMDQKIICPVHKMPDCSPLLNGCSIPNQLVGQVQADAATVRNWGRVE